MRSRSDAAALAGAAALAVLAVAGLGCATARERCPADTTVARHVYSGGGDAEWCRRADGARQGPESRTFENGVESVTGAYVDGAQSGVWRYRFNDGRNWRAERWQDGELLAVTLDPSAARLTPAELARLGPTTSGVIKLAAHDPIAGGPAREVILRAPNGAPRAAGAYDAEGLRTGLWRFWYPNGRLARELEFAAGVRDRAAREWYETGAPAADGFYAGGQRDGRWRFWDARGQLREVVYRRDDSAALHPAESSRQRPGTVPVGPGARVQAVSPAEATTGMLPASP